MMRSIVHEKIGLIDARVVSGHESIMPMTYIPEHLHKGRTITEQVNFTVFVIPYNWKHLNHARNRSRIFRVVAYGKLAGACARECSFGRSLDLTCYRSNNEEILTIEQVVFGPKSSLNFFEEAELEKLQKGGAYVQ